MGQDSTSNRYAGEHNDEDTTWGDVHEDCLPTKLYKVRPPKSCGKRTTTM
jgi:hypothetical protein